jgi:hypothetical protein
MATVDEDLSQLEKDIRQLKIEYDSYFGGGRKRPPTEIAWRIEQMVKRYGDKAGQLNFGQRFRLNNLTQTYAKYQDVFRKKMKQKEEGTVQRHFGAAARAIEAARQREKPAAPQPAAAEFDPRRARPRNYVISDPEAEADKVQQLYDALAAAKAKAGDKSGAMSLESFKQFVSSKTKQLRDKGAKEVEYVVSMEGNQVKLKARVK